MNRKNDIRSTEHFLSKPLIAMTEIFLMKFVDIQCRTIGKRLNFYKISDLLRKICIKMTRFDTMNLMLERRNNKQHHRLVHLNVTLLYFEVCWITLKHHSTTVMFFKANIGLHHQEIFHLMPSNLGANLLFKHAPSDLVCVKLMSLCPISSSSYALQCMLPSSNLKKFETWMKINFCGEGMIKIPPSIYFNFGILDRNLTFLFSSI